MIYRFGPVEIPPENPFKNDVLERKESVQFLAELVENAADKGPFVLAIDAPYGSGKTTVVSMLRSLLMQRNFSCVEINAWQVDNNNDPLIPLVSALDNAMRLDGDDQSKFTKSLDKLRSVTGMLVKRGVIAATKVATFGALDLEKEVEAVLAGISADTASDLISQFQKEEELSKRFRSELSAAVKELPSRDKKPALIFFIDELDRCRPDFAISLLERIKHMFDIDNVVFILSIDKKQLEAATCAIYGSNINAAEYLRKFIDIEFGLPRPNSKRFIEMSIKKAGLDELFLSKGQKNLQERATFVRFFSAIADARNLPLRIQERCITRLRVVLEQTPEHENVEPILVAMLVIARALDETLFHKMARGEAHIKEVLKFFHAEEQGLLPADDRAMIIGVFIGEMPDPERTSQCKEYSDAVANISTPQEYKHYASRIINMVNYRSEYRDGAGQAFSTVARRVDMAASLKN